MATGVRVLAFEVVIALLLCWISATQGSRISAPCTLDNCTSTRIGDPCSNPADCVAITSSQCRNDTCLCISGYMPKNESQECVLRTISDQCESDSDCSDAIDNSYCHGNRICRCRDGYLLEGSNCVARKLDDECDKQSDCTEVMNNTRCLRKKCECVNLYLREGNDTCRLRRLGDNCNKTIQCNPKEGQFRACLNGLCVCAKGYRRTPNDDGEFNCVKVTLGSTCSSKANCSHIPNSACVKRKCSCASGYTDVVGVSCRPLLLGDPCRLDSDCMMPHAVCSNKTCSCMKGFAVSNGSSQCTKMIVGDTECNTSEDCLNHFPNTACDSMGLCQCERQYYLNGSGSECLFRYVGDACSNDGECLYSVNSTECNNNICKCIDTHLPSGNKTDCTLKNLGGRPCTTDANCSQLVPHSSCDVDNSRTCFCNIGYYSNENFDECLEKRLSDPCLSDADCNTTNPNTVCSENTHRCECSPEFAPKFPEMVKNASKPFCSIRKIWDQSCQTKEECSSVIANSTCGSCVDAPGGSPCLQRCSESSNVTEAPETSTSSSRCPEQTCICERGFVAESEGERCERRKLRGNCSVDEDCNIVIPNSVCLTGNQVCYCAPGFLEDGIYVCTRRKIDDICLKQSDCQAAVPSSYCYRYISTEYGFCKCSSGYQVINAGTECRKRQIGDRTCQNETDCSDAINNSNCHHQMCVCNIGYYRSFDHTQCIKRKLFHDYCDDNRDCSAVIPNAVCDDLASRRCICPSGYYANNGTECKRRNINDTCQPGVMTDCSDAVTNSTCVNGVCKCVSGFFAIGNDTCVRRKINDSNSNCENLHDCADAVGNSSCENGMCLCDKGYYSSGGGTVCLQRQLNDTCNVTQDCSSVIPRSICGMGRCKCEEGFDVHDNSSRCVLHHSRLEVLQIPPRRITDERRRWHGGDFSSLPNFSSAFTSVVYFFLVRLITSTCALFYVHFN